MGMKVKFVVAVAATLLLSGGAQASIVEWDLDGAPGTQASTAVSSQVTGITGLNLGRGAGLTATAAGNSISASAWNNQTTDYFSFGFTVAGGYEADLSSLLIATRSSNTGPGTMGLYYSGDGFASALYTFNQAPGSNFVNSNVNLSALQNLTGTVEFRMFQIGTAAANGGATGSGGTFRISEYFDGSTYSNLQFDGTVTSVSQVPAPDSLALLISGLGLVGLIARRRKF